MGFSPKAGHVFDRFNGFPGVDHDCFAVGFNFLTAERPKKRIAECRCITDCVAKALAKRMTGGLQFLAGRAILIPCCRKALDADLVEPGFSIRDQRADDAIRYSEPTLPIITVVLRAIV